MRKLDEIVGAVRSGEPTNEDELRYAVVAFDVLLAQIDLAQYPAALRHYFVAAESDPREYVGPLNDPANPEARAWVRAMRNVKPPKEES